MKREPRGFLYALEPLRLKCDWEMQELQIKLGELNRKIAGLENEARHCDALIAGASAELAQQQGKAQVIYVDKQRLVLAYIAHQSQLAARARKLARELAAECEKTTRDLHRLRKFADGLEENRDEEIKDFNKTMERVDSAETDDAWLRGSTWRNKQ